MKPTVSLVIPMYNEELNIEHAVAAARESLGQHAGDYEIIIVDDASTDASPQIVSRIAAEDPHVRVLRHEQNRKLGGTLRTVSARRRRTSSSTWTPTSHSIPTSSAARSARWSSPART
jgi:hypothetical protein